MNAVLKHNGFPGSRCFQIENTGSKLKENTGISQITELSIVNWTIVICTFLFLLTRLATERKQEEICREFSLRLMKIIRLPRWVKSYTNLSKHFFTWQRALREENFTKVRNKLSTIVVIFANFPAKIPLPRKSSLLHIKTCDWRKVWENLICMQ